MPRILITLAGALLTAAACGTSTNTGTTDQPTALTSPRPIGATTAASPASTGAVANPAPTGITSEGAARLGPLAPQRVMAQVEAGDVRLSWQATGEAVAYYQCLRRTSPAGPWTAVGRTSADHTAFVDRSPDRGTYIYGVQAVNGSGGASPTTQSPAVTIR